MLSALACGNKWIQVGTYNSGHDVPCTGRRIDVNNEGGLDTRPSSLYWQIKPGVFLAYWQPCERCKHSIKVHKIIFKNTKHYQ